MCYLLEARFQAISASRSAVYVKYFDSWRGAQVGTGGVAGVAPGVVAGS